MLNRGSKLFSSFIAISVITLLITAPCSVRHAIQQTLNIEQTDVLNKSKSFQHRDCAEVNSIKFDFQSFSIENFKLISFPGFFEFENNKLTFWSKPKVSFPESQAARAVSPPLYVLFKQWKTHL